MRVSTGIDVLLIVGGTAVWVSTWGGSETWFSASRGDA